MLRYRLGKMPKTVINTVFYARLQLSYLALGGMNVAIQQLVYKRYAAAIKLRSQLTRGNSIKVLPHCVCLASNPLATLVCRMPPGVKDCTTCPAKKVRFTVCPQYPPFMLSGSPLSYLYGLPRKTLGRFS